MPDTTTARLNLIKPEIGASRDTWGTKTNTNWDTIDNILGTVMPIGAILDFAGPNPPAGFLLCDGRLISRVTYSDLFAAIGVYWGNGDGSTTFALPSTPGRSMLCAGTVTDDNGTSLSYTFAQKSGAVSRAITQANLPALTLTANTVAAHSHGGATAVGANHTHSIDVQGDHSHTTDVQGSHTHGVNDPGHYHGATLVRGNGSGALFLHNTQIQRVDYTNTDVATTGISLGVAGAHGHNISVAGAHAHNAGYSGNLQLGINPDGSHNHSVPLGGSGTLLSLITPLLVCTKIIYAGSQAAALVAAAASVAPTRRLLAAPLRGGMAA